MSRLPAVAAVPLLATVPLLAACGAPDAPPVETVVQPDTGFYQEVSWSPDGRTLLVSILEPAAAGGFEYRVHRIGVDGSGFAPVSAGPRDYWTAWSPDGRLAAMGSRRDGRMDIRVVDLETGEARWLTGEPGDDTHPDYSPDGSRIAFVSDRAGPPAVWVMNADGSGPRSLGQHEGRPYNPRWSPDGTRIAYYETAEDGTDHLYVMDADGGGRTRVAEGVWPSWSPDGRRLLFAREGGLFEIAPDGSGLTRLAVGDTSGPNVFYGRYSPDGSRLAYLASSDTHVSVYIRPVGGGDAVRLLTRPRPGW